MKATLITGASGGIGEAFARRLARDGHNLVLVARSGDKLRQICDELEQKHAIEAHPIAADLANRSSAERIFEETEGRAIEIDWLINNAGFGSMGDFAKLEPSRELEMIDVNIRSLVALTHYYLQQMRTRKSGIVINVSSAAGFQPIPFMATYAATKAFVTSFSEAIAEENRHFGIQVLALCPGPTKTNFHAAAKMETSLSVKGFQTAEEVVETAMLAVGTGRAKVVSGWTNWMVSTGVNFLPNSLITRVMGRGLRSRFQKA